MSTAATHPDDSEIEGLDGLIERMDAARTAEEWSYIVQDYVGFGNAKLSDNIATFNFGAAIDCVNRGTSQCQVGANECYAVKSENRHAHVLDYRRRQEFVWDSLDPETFATAFLRVLDRKVKPVNTLRLNQSGDFRVNGDIVRANEVARILANHGITTYTYTASSHLDWSLAEHFTVNASNDQNPDADQRFKVVDSAADIPEGGFHCPGSCGACRACFHPGGDADIYEVFR